MRCQVPFVDFPTCEIPYSATNWWYNPYTAVMEAGWLFLGWDLWRSTLKLTRYGIPRSVDAAQFLAGTSFSALQSLYFLNPQSLRSGGWLAVMTSCADYLVAFLGGLCILSILVAVRAAARLQEGKHGLPKWELRAYFAASAFLGIICIPSMVVRARGQLSKVPAEQLRHCELIRNSGYAGISIAHLVLALLFIRTFRKDRRSAALLKTFKVISYGFLVLFCFRFVLVYKRHSSKWDRNVGEMKASLEILNVDVPMLESRYVGTMALAAWMAPRFRNQLGLQWESAHGNEETWWVDMKEAVMSGAIVLFFGLGLYAPLMMQLQYIDVFLKGLTFVLCFSATLWIEKSSRASREYLFDLSVAAYLRKRDTLMDMIEFRLLSVNETVFDFSLFCTMPFSKATPWPFGLQNLDWMGKVNNFTFIDENRGVFSTTLILFYFGWLLVSFCLRAFPPSYRLNQAHLVITWFLYLPCGLTATRFLLGGTQCREDGTLAWDGTPCDGSTAHRMILIFGISGVLWFVCLPSLYYAGVNNFKLCPLVVENPTVSVHNQFFRALAIFSAIYLTNTSRVIVDLVIVCLVTAQQFYDPLIIGRAGLNSLRAGAFLAALSCHVVAPLNFVLPDSSIPITIYIICVPTMFVIGFKGSYKHFAVISKKIQLQALTGANVDFTESNLPPRLLGSCLHAPPLNQFLRTHLNVPTKRAKSQSTIVPESELVPNDTLISLALAHLTTAISTRCGRHALQQFPEYVRCMSEWLDSPHRSATIACVLAMADIEALHTEMRTHVMPALLTAWRLVDDACHTSCAEVIRKIRGMDKIIVSFGPIQQLRRIVIPLRTVWVVPYAPTHTKDDPIDAVLTFPPTWDPPLGDIMPINVPHLCILVARSRVVANFAVDAFLGSRGGAESVHTVVGQGSEGEGSVTEEDGEGSRSVAGKGGGRATMVAWEGKEPAVLAVGQGVEGKALVAGEGEDGASSVARDSTLARSATLRRKTVRATVVQLGKGWAVVKQKIRTWGPAPIRRNMQHETRRAHILFSLDDHDLVTDEEDNVPTLRLRQALTAFYAFKVLPRDWSDEEDNVDHGDETEKYRMEKEDT